MRRLSLALMVLLLLVAACSSSGDSSSGDSSSADSSSGDSSSRTSRNGQASREEPWPAPADPMAKAREAGLVPEDAERLQYHVHAHLDVFIDGNHILVPGGIGIDTKNPGVHSGTLLGQPAYGGISVPCDQPCISPLHTHDVSGIIHTESATEVENTLGQLFTEWGVVLDDSCVATYCKPATPIEISIDGEQFTGDPRTIALRDMREIAIVIGKAPAEIPAEGDFSAL